MEHDRRKDLGMGCGARRKGACWHGWLSQVLSVQPTKPKSLPITTLITFPIASWFRTKKLTRGLHFMKSYYQRLRILIEAWPTKIQKFTKQDGTVHHKSLHHNGHLLTNGNPIIPVVSKSVPAIFPAISLS